MVTSHEGVQDVLAADRQKIRPLVRQELRSRYVADVVHLVEYTLDSENGFEDVIRRKSQVDAAGNVFEKRFQLRFSVYEAQDRRTGERDRQDSDGCEAVRRESVRVWALQLGG